MCFCKYNSQRKACNTSYSILPSEGTLYIMEMLPSRDIRTKRARTASTAKKNATSQCPKNCPRKSIKTLRTTFEAQDASTETLPRCTEPPSVHFQQPCSHGAIQRPLGTRSQQETHPNLILGGIWYWMTLDDIGC